jgi:sulfate/thiosulfate transport system permease protein
VAEIAAAPILPHRVLPGFGPTLGLTVFVLSLVVIVPLGALFAKASGLAAGEMLALLATPRVAAAFRVSFGIALLASLVNGIVGLLIAWVLVRYDFPGRRLFDAIVDLPFALPTAVAGIALTSLYADTGWIGGLLAPLRLDIAFTPLGIFVALLFIGLPYVIRTVQPVLADLEREAEDAALTLGAGVWQTFRRVVAPPLLPAVLTGTALAFARGVGEYGSVIFIAGNMPGVSEIVPLLIVVHLEQFDYAGAAVLAVAMLLVSFAALLVINLLQAWSRKRHGG